MIEPLLPNKPGGVPRVDNRRVLNGIFLSLGDLVRLGATCPSAMVRAPPNIPPNSNRRWKPCFSKRLYRDRNLIERFFSKLKHFRRVATRYDRLAANCLAMAQFVSMRL